MSETAIHYGYKSPGSFCFEAFKHLLYPNAIAHTVVRGFLPMNVRVLKERNCLVYHAVNTGARLIRS